jgi:hypothetical protein
MAGPSEERELRILESRVFALPVGSLEQRVTALEQANWQLGAAKPVCVITLLFVVTDSSSGDPIAGVTVEVKGSSGDVVATGATDGDGQVTLIVFGLDAYTYEATDTGYTTAMGTVAGATCGATVETDVALVSTVIDESGTFSGSFKFECNAVLAGAAITLTDHTSGSVYWSGTTDGSGDFTGTVALPPGTLVDWTGTTAAGLVGTVIHESWISATVLSPAIVLGPVVTDGSHQESLGNVHAFYAGGSSGGLLMVPAGCLSTTQTWWLPSGGSDPHSLQLFYTLGSGLTLFSNFWGSSIPPTSLTLAPFHAVWTVGALTVTIED